MPNLKTARGSVATRGSRPLLARVPFIGIGLAIAGGLIFGVLAYNVRTNGPLLAWDLPMIQALHQRAVHDSPLVFTLMKICGALGRETAAIITVLLAGYWLVKRRWRELTLLLVGVAGGEIWFEILSRFFGRHRPVFPDPLDPLPGPGFPSGHSQTAVLLYGLLFYLLLPRLRSGRARLLAAAITVLIALLNSHSPIPSCPKLSYNILRRIRSCCSTSPAGRCRMVTLSAVTWRPACAVKWLPSKCRICTARPKPLASRSPSGRAATPSTCPALS